MIPFGVFGYFMRKLGYEPAPLVLGFMLGPLMEENLRDRWCLARRSDDLRRAADLGRPCW